jgi:hypothetical protein
MTSVTWSTAPIPACRLAVGDRIVRNGLRLPVEFVHDPGAGRVFFGTSARRYLVDSSDPITVEVPDEPVDGYSLWKPKPGVWPSGCVCPIRANPKMPGNWETVARDEQCRGHYDWNDYED